MRRPLLALFCLAACDTPGHRDTGGPPVDFTIAGLSFHVSSGAAVVSSGGLAFYLSDQADRPMSMVSGLEASPHPTAIFNRPSRSKPTAARLRAH